MYFSGESSRKRVDLGGRSSKERDRDKLVQQTKLERERREKLRIQKASALVIQKCFRGRKAVQAERSKIREEFYLTFGNRCQKVDRDCFDADSKFFRQLLFFFDARNSGDFFILVETCRLLLQFVRVNGDLFFLRTKDCSEHSIMDNSVKQLAYACLQAVHQNRNQLKDQLLMSSEFAGFPAVCLLETVVILTNPNRPRACKTIRYLSQRRVHAMLRDIVCLGMFASQGWFDHYTHQLAVHLRGDANFLPADLSRDFPGYACLLGNILEVAGAALSRPKCSIHMAIDFAAVSAYMLDALPPLKSFNRGSKESEDEMAIDEEYIVELPAMDADLEQQITDAINSDLLAKLVNVVGDSLLNGSHGGELHNEDVSGVGAICAFLHTTFNTLPVERIMPGLALQNHACSYALEVYEAVP
ncbi:hypothetical protein IFM89_039186 [Coptis chinensis]|uniref:HECT-type E3 ubiquitin transferase n=1 Tax=Coptis chinensis TaxID=261450 RepID=A0A835HBB1_9MAGN|nr:hypothetical protein IFM89_039186 [Coptis chinensis]